MYFTFKYLKLGFPKVLKAVSTTQVVVRAFSQRQGRGSGINNVYVYCVAADKHSAYYADLLLTITMSLISTDIKCIRYLRFRR